MATTGSHLEALSAFAGFISSYLALMRGVVQQRRVKHQFFCLLAFNLLLNMNLKVFSRTGSSMGCQFIFYFVQVVVYRGHIVAVDGGRSVT